MFLLFQDEQEVQMLRTLTLDDVVEFYKVNRLVGANPESVDVPTVIDKSRLWRC